MKCVNFCFVILSSVQFGSTDIIYILYICHLLFCMLDFNCESTICKVQMHVDKDVCMCVIWMPFSLNPVSLKNVCVKPAVLYNIVSAICTL